MVPTSGHCRLFSTELCCLQRTPLLAGEACVSMITLEATFVFAMNWRHAFSTTCQLTLIRVVWGAAVIDGGAVEQSRLFSTAVAHDALSKAAAELAQVV